MTARARTAARRRGVRPRLALLRRWLRGAARRPQRAIAVVASLAVMSVATVGALLAADALEQLFLADAAAEWGPVDLEARADANSVHPLSTGRLLAVEGAPAVTAAAPRLVLQAVASTSTATEPGVGLLGVGAEEASFPPLEPLEGQGDPLQLAPEEVIVNRRLADRLELQVGDEVQVTAAVPRWDEEVATSATPLTHPPFALALDLTVAGIVADTSTADLHRTPNALVRRDLLAAAAGMDGQVTVTHLRVDGSGQEAAERAVDALTPVALVHELDVDPVAAEQLALAEEEGGLFRSILLTLALLVVAAAVVATRGLLVTLAEERAPELAVLRAHGCRRRTAAGLLAVEATAYGILGAALGVLGGLPFGRLLATLLAGHFAELSAGRGREQVALDVDPGVGAVLVGGGIVAVVAVLAGRSAALAVLDSPLGEVLRGGALAVRPRPPSRRRAGAVLLGGAAVLGAGAVTGGPLVFVGVTALLGGWWLRVRHDRPAGAGRDRLDQRAAVGGLLWAVLGAALMADPAGGVQSAFGVLVVASLSAILCATVLAVPRLPSIMRLVRAGAPLGATQAALRTAAQQAAAARRRSTTTILVLGAVLFMVAALSVLGSAQALPVERQGGGYDVVARGVARLEAREIQALPEVAAVATVPDAVLPETAYAVQRSDGRSLAVPYPVTVAAATGSLARTSRFGVASALPDLGSAGEAIALLERQRGSAVVDRAALPEGARVGDDVVIDVGLTPRRLRLIAVLDTFLLSTVLLNEADFAQVAELRGPTTALVQVAEGTEPEALVTLLEDVGRPAGVTAETMEERRREVVAVNRTFTDTFTLMLVLGLAVAAASLAAYVVRAARERRPELAVLRAMGLPAAGTRLALAAEPALTAVVGMAIGLAVGLGLVRVLFTTGLGDLAFVVDWGRVAAVGAGALAVILLTCAATAAAVAPRDLGSSLRDLG